MNYSLWWRWEIVLFCEFTNFPFVSKENGAHCVLFLIRWVTLYPLWERLV